MQLNLRNYLVSELQSLVKRSILGGGNTNEMINFPKHNISSLQNVRAGNIENLIKPRSVSRIKKMLPDLKSEFPEVIDIQMNILISGTKEDQQTKMHRTRVEFTVYIGMEERKIVYTLDIAENKNNMAITLLNMNVVSADNIPTRREVIVINDYPIIRNEHIGKRVNNSYLQEAVKSFFELTGDTTFCHTCRRAIEKNVIAKQLGKDVISDFNNQVYCIYKLNALGQAIME